MIKNSDEFEFGLSTHAAWMLTWGIEDYVRLIDRLYRQKIEPADYCHIMICTAKREAVRLKDWAVKNKLPCIQMSRLDELIEKIEGKRERYSRLEDKLAKKMGWYPYSKKAAT